MKTLPTPQLVADFLATVEHPTRRADAHTLVELMSRVTGESPVMWGPSIVGFGTCPMTYADGSKKEWMLVAFSPRKSNVVLYIMDGFSDYDRLLGQLGKHKTGKACLYLNKLADVDLEVLETLVATSVAARLAKAAAE